MPRQEMGACLLEVRTWQLECIVMNSFRYVGHESPKRHKRDEEATGSGEGEWHLGQTLL